MPLEIVTVPCRTDNYAFLLHDRTSRATAVVDVPDAAPVRRALAERRWDLTDILITHHHEDHIAGVDALRKERGARVVGAAADAHRLPPLDLAVSEGDTVKVGNVEGKVLEVPGHTSGHIAYVFPGAAFTGDSLMALGCGRLFECDAETMWNTLRKLRRLPPDTQIYSGHEYTEANGRFALTIEPENQALKERLQVVRDIRAKGLPTVPSPLWHELATNPFLRARSEQVKAYLGMRGKPDAEVFAEIRHRKDRF